MDTTINYAEKIPNNVNLAEDRTLQRALERWQPEFLDWWRDMGPEARRTSTSICAPRSASSRRAGRSSSYVKMPDYRWGIFLHPASR